MTETSLVWLNLIEQLGSPTLQRTLMETEKYDVETAKVLDEMTQSVFNAREVIKELITRYVIKLVDLSRTSKCK